LSDLRDALTEDTADDLRDVLLEDTSDLRDVIMDCFASDASFVAVSFVLEASFGALGAPGAQYVAKRLSFLLFVDVLGLLFVDVLGVMVATTPSQGVGFAAAFFVEEKSSWT